MTRDKGIKLSVFCIAVLILGIFLYRWSPYKIEFLGHYDKIWAHRVNDISKLHKAQRFFDGVELDLVFHEKGNYLDVTHPPGPSRNLYFEYYLQEVRGHPFLWLDIKNLNAGNSNAVLNKLRALLSEKDYPLQKILIETRYPDALPIFSRAGFKTSYYLPPGLAALDPSKLKTRICEISNVLQEQTGTAISSSYEDYEIMKAYFPDTDKYIWILDGITKRGFLLPREILADTTVKVVLVPLKP